MKRLFALCFVVTLLCASCGLLKIEPPEGTLAIDAGADGIVGTYDDLYIIDAGADGELGTADDVAVYGESKLQIYASMGAPVATAFGFGQYTMLAQGAVGLATMGYALFASPKRKEDD